MKTDLRKILSVSGEPGLFTYLSQGKAGIIAESLLTGKRTSFGMKSRVTSLSDISIYTDEEELPLREVFLQLKEYLVGEAAPDGKDQKALVAFFDAAFPSYDRDRFYPSHMKKVVQWYNLLREKASLDFEDPDAEEQQEADQPEEVSEQ